MQPLATSTSVYRFNYIVTLLPSNDGETVAVLGEPTVKANIGCGQYNQARGVHTQGFTTFYHHRNARATPCLMYRSQPCFK